MAFTCANCKGQHDTVAQAKACYAGISAVVTTASVPDWQTRHTLPGGRVFYFGHKTHRDGPLSLPQYKYISDLKGDTEHALTLTYHGAHLYINELRHRPRPKDYWKASDPPPEPEPEPIVKREPEKPDPKVLMIDGLLPSIPDGYYAVEEYDGDPVTFIRLSSPKKGRFMGSRKIQTVHGSGYSGARLEEVAVHWPSGQWSWYKPFIKERLLLLITDYMGAALRYAAKLGNCARCNANLTDERSRWYGIGPECEKHWPQHMEQVNVTKGQWYPGAVSHG